MRAKVGAGLATMAALFALWVAAGGDPGGGTPTPTTTPTATVTTTPTPGPGTANLWVDTNGGTCSRQATAGAYSDPGACSSVNAAYAAASPGDLIMWKGGSYAAQTITKRSLGTPVVTVRPAPGENVSTTGMSILATNLVIDGGDTTGVNETNRISAQPNGIGMEPSTSTASNPTWDTLNTVIEDVHLTSTYLKVNGVTFRYSEIGPDNACTQAEDMIASDHPEISANPVALTNIHFIGNYIHDLNLEGCPSSHSDMFDIAWANSSIKGNVITGCGTQCIFNTPNGSTAPRLSITIENNFIDSSPCPGCSVATAPNTVQSDGDWTFNYNTLRGSVRAGPYNQSVLLMRGNLLLSAQGNCSPTNTGGSTVTWAGNVFPASGGSTCGTTATRATPTLTNAFQGDFHIAPGSFSAVAGRGDPAYCPATDFDEQPRPQGASTCDAGADEVN